MRNDIKILFNEAQKKTCRTNNNEKKQRKKIAARCKTLVLPYHSTNIASLAFKIHLQNGVWLCVWVYLYLFGGSFFFLLLLFVLFFIHGVSPLFAFLIFVWASDNERTIRFLFRVRAIEKRYIIPSLIVVFLFLVLLFCFNSASNAVCFRFFSKWRMDGDGLICTAGRNIPIKSITNIDFARALNEIIVPVKWHINYTIGGRITLPSVRN